jgi:hypothetical protein
VDDTGGACSTHKRDDKCIWVLLRKPEGKEHLGRPSRKWEGSVKMDLERTGWDV